MFKRVPRVLGPASKILINVYDSDLEIPPSGKN